MGNELVKNKSDAMGSTEFVVFCQVMYFANINDEFTLPWI